MKPRMTDVVLPPTFEQTARAGSAAAHTAGPCEVDAWMVRHDGLVIAIVQPKLWNGEPQISRAEVDANATLIAEAFNVMHETGASPRQLTEQRAELLEALTACQRALTVIVDPKAIKSSSAAHAYVQAVEAKSKARAAIAKAKGGAQ